MAKRKRDSITEAFIVADDAQRHIRLMSRALVAAFLAIAPWPEAVEAATEAVEKVTRRSAV